MDLERLKELTEEYLINGITVFDNEQDMICPLFNGQCIDDFYIGDDYGDWMSLIEFLNWLIVKFEIKER